MISDLTDRLNPIVVKEVRQGLRNRTFAATFGLLLGACLVISLVAFGLAMDASPSSSLGVGVFTAYFSCLVIVGLIVQPLHAYRTFARERTSEGWAPLVLTGLKPRGILRGKVTSNLVQGLLYASATGPFLLFSYLLGGVALVLILQSLLWAAVGQVLLTTIAVSGATFADSRVGRGLLQGVMVVVFWSLATSVFSYSPLSSLLGGTSSLLLLAVALPLFWLTLAALFFEVAAGRLMTTAENHALGPRIAALVHLGVLAGLVAVLGDGSGTTLELLCVYAIGHVFAFGLFGMTEVPEAAALRRATGTIGLLRPGPLAGLGFTLLLAGGVAAVAAFGLATDLLGDGAFARILALDAWVLLYVGASVALGAGPLRGLLGDPVTLRITIVILCVLAFIVGAMELTEGPLDTLLNPTVGDVELDGAAMELGFALAAVFLAGWVLRRREVRANG